MRFFIQRIIKNFPTLNKYWKCYLQKSDFNHYKKYCGNYKIIPFGCYCLPRIITQINLFKPTKAYGEESFPFDLAFSNLNSNLELFYNDFSDFFEHLEYNNETNYWQNTQYNLSFIHDKLSYHDFKQRYLSRINNLYKYLNNHTLHIYFVIADFEPISNAQIDKLTKKICKYRSANTFDIIIINQSKNKSPKDYDNIHFIDLSNDKSFFNIQKNGNWVGELKKMKTLNARIFNHKIKTKLAKIIKT